jgi:hypothetical protein
LYKYAYIIQYFKHFDYYYLKTGIQINKKIKSYKLCNKIVEGESWAERMFRCPHLDHPEAIFIG